MKETQALDKSTIRPGRGWYGVALGLMLLGPLLAVCLFFHNLYWGVPTFINFFQAVLLIAVGTLGGSMLAIVALIRRTHANSALKHSPLSSPSSSIKEDTQNNEANVWAMLCHISSLVGFVIPFGNIFAPLIFWLVKKNEYELVDDQGKQSLNFQLSMLIYYVAAFFLIFAIIGIFLLPLLFLFHFILVIIASIEAAHGKHFRYPLTIPLLK